MAASQSAGMGRARTALSRAADGYRTSRSPKLLPWLGSVLVAVAATGWAMFREIATFGHPAAVQTGLDFSNNTWRAVRGLLSGTSIYGPTHAIIPGIGPAWPVGPHVPGSLLWQAPFAALPLRAAIFTYAFASILAIWAAAFLLTQPRGPLPVLLTACCAAFAISAGCGVTTLRLGQPTGFMLLGLALVVRARRPWLAGLGFMLAASTIQTGVPLALALLVLGGWAVVWRGSALVLAASLPPVLMGIASQGVTGFILPFVSRSLFQLHRPSKRIDLGALLARLGVSNQAVRIGAGLLVAGLALLLLARLPARLRRIDYPPVLCLVISFMLLCTYHQAYDMILVGGAVIPIILVNDQSRAMLPVFGLAGISAYFAGYNIGFVIDPVALLGMGLVTALAVRHTSPPGPRDGSSPGLSEPPASVARIALTS